MKAPQYFGVLSAALACVTLASWANATDGPEPHELRYDLRTDVAVTAVGGALLLTSELLRPTLAPASCRWCDRNADGSDALNGLDSAVRSGLRWSHPDVADAASYVAAYVLVPVVTYGGDALAASNDNGLHAFPTDALLITEAAVLAFDANQLVKFLAGRERPFVHVLPADQKGRTAHPSDNNLSFFSGHTTFAFALAASSGTIASMRGYRWAPLVWAAGMTLAATTGYLRIAGDRHYFTDVVTGAAVGSAFGVGVPFLFHRPRQEALAVSMQPFPGGIGVGCSGIW